MNSVCALLVIMKVDLFMLGSIEVGRGILSAIFTGAILGCVILSPAAVDGGKKVHLKIHVPKLVEHKHHTNVVFVHKHHHHVKPHHHHHHYHHEDEHKDSGKDHGGNHHFDYDHNYGHPGHHHSHSYGHHYSFSHGSRDGPKKRPKQPKNAKPKHTKPKSGKAKSNNDYFDYNVNYYDPNTKTEHYSYVKFSPTYHANDKNRVKEENHTVKHESTEYETVGNHNPELNAFLANSNLKDRYEVHERDPFDFVPVDPGKNQDSNDGDYGNKDEEKQKPGNYAEDYTNPNSVAKYTSALKHGAIGLENSNYNAEYERDLAEYIKSYDDPNKDGY